MLAMLVAALVALCCMVAPVVAHAANVGGGAAGTRLAANEYHWAFYEIANWKSTKASDYSGPETPLVLVFSTNTLGEKYNSGSALYGNGLKKVVGSGENSSGKTYDTWKSGTEIKKATEVPWNSAVDLNRVYAVQNANDSDVIAPIYAGHLFQAMGQLRDISDLRYWDTSQTLSLEYLFHTCKSLRDVSAVSDWDVGKVSSLDNLFRECDIVELEIWDWKPAPNVKLSKTFYGCANLETIYCHNTWATSWTTGNSDNYPFAKCSSSLKSTSSGKTWSSGDTSAAYCNPTTGYFTGNPKDATPEVPVTRVVQLPKGISLIYNGKPQVGIQGVEDVTLAAAGGSGVETSSGSAVATNAGTYSVTASLTKPETTQWMSGDHEPHDIQFTIEKAELFFEPPEKTLYFANGKKFQIPITFTTDSEGIVFSEEDISAIEATTTADGVDLGKYTYLGDGKTVMLEVTVKDKDLADASLTFRVKDGAKNIKGEPVTGTLHFKETNVPQPNSLTYNGLPQVGIDASDEYTLSELKAVAGTGAQSDGAEVKDGAAMATHAGTYEVTATLKGAGTTWSDEEGGNAERKIQFTIAKATPEISINPSSITRYVGDSTLSGVQNLAFTVKFPNSDVYGTNKGQAVTPTGTDSPKCEVAVADQSVFTVGAPSASDGVYTAIITPKAQGTRSVTVSVGTASANSGDFNRVTRSATVTVKSLNPPTDEKTFTFDGSKKYGIELGNADLYSADVTLTAQTPKTSSGEEIADGFGEETAGTTYRYYGTHAGSYTVTASLKDKTKTCWSNGTTEDRTLTFTINKATSKLVVSPEVLELEAGSAGNATAYLSLNNAYPTAPYAGLKNDEITVESASGEQVEVGPLTRADSGRVSFSVTPNVSTVPGGALKATVKFAGNDDINAAPDATITIGVKTYTLTYQLTGGKVASGSALNPTPHVNNETVKLDEGTGLAYGTTYQGKTVIFLGWAEKAPSAPLTKGSAASELLKEVTFETKDITVYAVWGTDSDGDGTADVNEDRVKLSYDVNGGDAGSGPKDVENLVPGDVVTLATEPKPTHKDETLDGKDTKVVFAGWSKTKATSPLAQGAEDAPELIKSYAINKETDKDGATVYAVWGYDVNGNGTADYLENLIALTYAIPYGEKATADQPPASVNVLPDLKGYQLWTASADHAAPRYTGSKGTGVFIGWSKDNHEEELFTSKPSDLITTIDIGSGDEVVYAVWGADTNGNGKADYAEDHYTLTYDINGGNSTAPADSTGYIVGQTIELNTTAKPTHAQAEVSGKRVDVLFVGWSETKQDVLAYGASTNTTSEVTMVEGGKTVYAVWAQDANGNGTPDIQEPGFRLTYSVNGGDAGSQPTDSQLYLEGIEVELDATKAPTHRPQGGVNVLFVGWTTENNGGKVYGFEDAKPETCTSVKMAKGGTTVYAVWALDANNNKQPDFDDSTIKFTFDLVGGTGDSAPAGITVLPGTSQSLPPVSDASGQPKWSKKDKEAVAVGWSTTRTDAIFDKTGKATIGGTERELSKFLAGSPVKVALGETANKTFYAVYAVDENKNGQADYLEATAHVEYYASGGVAANSHVTIGSDGKFYTSPEGYVEATSAKLETVDWGKTQIKKDKAVLIGWSSSAHAENYSAAPDSGDLLENSVTIPSKDEGEPVNAKVYAAWAVDENENGAPDYSETKRTLTYELNGGSGTAPVQEEHLAGIEVELKGGTGLTHSDNAIVIGWSTSQLDVFGMDADPAAVASSIIADNKLVMPDKDTTVYAAWASDVDGDGKADYLEAKVHVEYWPNGGVNPKTNALYSANKAFYTDPTTYVPGQSDVKVLGTANAKEKIAKTGCTLIGWSRTVNPEIATTANPSDLIALEDSITLESEEENTKLYAVWAADTNGNGTPDYKETKTKLHYDFNPDASANSPTSPALTNNVEYVPSSSKVTVYAQLWQDEGKGTSAAWHQKTNDKAVFVGWTSNSTENSSNVWDVDPADSITLLGTRVKIEKVESEPYTQTVYAVWAKDGNANGIPDYEDTLTLSFESNSSVFPAGEGREVSGMPAEMRFTYGAGTITLPTQIPTCSTPAGKSPIVFMGWSWTADPTLYSKRHTLSLSAGDIFSAEDVLAGAATFTSSDIKEGHNTLYAAWGYDTDGNGVADVLENQFTLTYLDAVQSNNTATQEASAGTRLAMQDPTATPKADPFKDKEWAKPTGTESRSVVFIGWAEGPVNLIVSKAMTADQTNELNARLHRPGDFFEMPDEDAYLYAAWGYDTDDNGVADYEQDKAWLRYVYDYSLGGALATKPEDKEYLVGETVEKLWNTADSNNGNAWQCETPSGHAVFIGWTLDNAFGSEVVAEGANADTVEASLLKVEGDSRITPITADKTLYAVWALDANNNDTADYSEEKAKLTYYVSPGKDSGWSQLASGEGVTNPAEGLVQGKSYTLLNGTVLDLKKTYEGSENPAIFAGWSTTNPADSSTTFSNGSDEDKRLHKLGIIPENEADTEYELSNLLVGANSNSYTIPMDATDNKLYAIYAVDEWGSSTDGPDGVPDYLEKAQRVEYYANGGVAVDGNTQVAADGLFYICADHHSAGQQAQLMSISEGREHIKHLEGTITTGTADDGSEETTLVKPDPANPEDGVLIGWSEYQHLELVATEEELAEFACPNNEIEDFPRVGNARVFALWGADTNGNDVWDVREQQITVRFDLLKGESASGAVQPEEKHLLPRQTFPTPEGDWKLTENGTVGVFYGWTTTEVAGVVSRDGSYVNDAGMRYQLDAKQVTKAGETFIVPDTGGGEIVLYAVYGVDSNGNGVADYFEDGNPVRYHANSGTWARAVAGVSDSVYSCAHHHVANEPNVELLAVNKAPATKLARENCALIGWSEKENPALCTDLASETTAGLIKSETITMPAHGAENVYAVWAQDNNKDGIADYRESANQYVEYHSAEGVQPNGDAFANPFAVSERAYLAEETGVPLLSLNAAKGYIVREGFVLLGWTSDAQPDVPRTGTQAQVERLLLESVTMPKAGEGNAKVWAYWAVDENKDGIADYLQYTPPNPSGPGNPSDPTDPDNPDNPEEPGDEQLMRVYRLYNWYTHEHLYTRDVNEIRVLTTKYDYAWLYEGVAWTCPTTSNSPVYRLYNHYTHEHLYTRDYHEVMELSEGFGRDAWEYEGVCWFSDEQERVPIYRLFNQYASGPSARLFTTDANEVKVNTHLPQYPWTEEGIGWYAAAPSISSADAPIP